MNSTYDDNKSESDMDDHNFICTFDDLGVMLLQVTTVSNYFFRISFWLEMGIKLLATEKVV